MFQALSLLDMYPPEILTGAHGTCQHQEGWAGRRRRRSGSPTTLDESHHNLFASNPQQLWQNKENMEKKINIYICNSSGHLQS